MPADRSEVVGFSRQVVLCSQTRHVEIDRNLSNTENSSTNNSTMNSSFSMVYTSSATEYVP